MWIVRCKKCKGEKTVTEKTRQEIFVEPGMNDRQRIVLAGAGDQEVRTPFELQ
jgi:DnaJ homolog subfamily A member 2